MSTIFMDPPTVSAAGSTATRVGGQSLQHAGYFGSHAMRAVAMPPHLAARLAAVSVGAAGNLSYAAEHYVTAGGELRARAELMLAIQEGRAPNVGVLAAGGFAAGAGGLISGAGRLYNTANKIRKGSSKVQKGLSKLQKVLTSRRRELDKAFSKKSLADKARAMMKKGKEGVEGRYRARREIILGIRDGANKLTGGLAGKVARSPITKRALSKAGAVLKVAGKVARVVSIAQSVYGVGSELSKGHYKAATVKAAGAAFMMNPVAAGLDIASDGLLSSSITMLADASEGVQIEAKANNGDYGPAAKWAMHASAPASDAFARMLEKM